MSILSAAAADWAVFGGMLNFGHVPTFHGDGLVEPRLEANIFGFEGDLRGRNVKIGFIQHLRTEKKFDGAAELVDQLKQDEAQARQVLGLTDAGRRSGRAAGQLFGDGLVDLDGHLQGVASFLTGHLDGLLTPDRPHERENLLAEIVRRSMLQQSRARPGVRLRRRARWWR